MTAPAAPTHVDIGAMIVSTPGTVGGKPRIDGTRIGVHRIAEAHVELGLTAEQIIADVYDHLELVQVYAALAYFYANRAEIEKILDDEKRFVAAFFKKYPEGYWGPDNDRGMPELDD